MRAFLGLALPEDTRHALADLQQQLGRDLRGVGWVPPEALHITLKFLGEVTESQHTAIRAAVTEVAQMAAPFPVRLDRLGAFPSLKDPRILWVGLAQGHEEMATLAQRLEAVAADLGWAREERPFASHVTIARLRSPRPPPALHERIRAVRWEPPRAWRVDAVTLYQSVLGAGGSRYVPLAQMPMRQTA